MMVEEGEGLTVWHLNLFLLGPLVLGLLGQQAPRVVVVEGLQAVVDHSSPSLVVVLLVGVEELALGEGTPFQVGRDAHVVRVGVPASDSFVVGDHAGGHGDHLGLHGDHLGLHVDHLGLHGDHLGLLEDHLEVQEDQVVPGTSN